MLVHVFDPTGMGTQGPRGPTGSQGNPGPFGLQVGFALLIVLHFRDLRARKAVVHPAPRDRKVQKVLLDRKARLVRKAQ